jgi:hypothetical protein
MKKFSKLGAGGLRGMGDLMRGMKLPPNFNG